MVCPLDRNGNERIVYGYGKCTNQHWTNVKPKRVYVSSMFGEWRTMGDIETNLKLANNLKKDLYTGLSDTKPQNVQGVLAQRSTDLIWVAFNAFHGCLFWATQPDRNPFQPDLKTWEQNRKVPLQAGDLLILIRAWPWLQITVKKRCGMANTFPWCLQAWKRSLKIGESSLGKTELLLKYAFPGDPRNWEQERYSRAKLNALGEKLLGLTPW